MMSCNCSNCNPLSVPKGPPGPAGPAGPTGPAGAAGSSISIVQNILTITNNTSTNLASPTACGTCTVPLNTLQNNGERLKIDALIEFIPSIVDPVITPLCLVNLVFAGVIIYLPVSYMQINALPKYLKLEATVDRISNTTALTIATGEWSTGAGLNMQVTNLAGLNFTTTQYTAVINAAATAGTNVSVIQFSTSKIK
jgi:hypothetical protein